ncbi:hypothetical protein [Nonomuraea sediminis]|uniref:hypothetical protein n=1 Tax=Nonomuraea sediminis TaxID=2835864 RepID=UPI001BDC5BD0|nr:hypothetical protein [Nonomuraea sediminis]
MTSEKRKVGSSTLPLTTTYDQQESPEAKIAPGVFVSGDGKLPRGGPPRAVLLSVLAGHVGSSCDCQVIPFRM